MNVQTINTAGFGHATARPSGREGEGPQIWLHATDHSWSIAMSIAEARAAKAAIGEAIQHAEEMRLQKESTNG